LKWRCSMLRPCGGDINGARRGKIEQLIFCTRFEPGRCDARLWLV
jgi:hypothetical protein